MNPATVSRSPSTRVIVLDVHAHLAPRRPKESGRIEGVEWTDKSLHVDGAHIAKPELFQATELLRWMDANGVVTAWVSIPPTLYRPKLDAARAREWADGVNEGLASICNDTPDRLAPLFHLPFQHPAVAAEVAAGAIRRGQTRFAMPAGDATLNLALSAVEYEPLWSVLDAAQAFLFLHPSRGCDARLDAFYLQNLLGNPTETAIAAAHLAMSGAVERHPDITFCLAHGGGTAAALLGRLEQGQESRRPGAYLGGEGVRRAFRRFCVDCITHDADALALVARTFGDDHVLFGSDWPFEMGLGEPHDRLASVAESLRHKILVDNARRLLQPTPPRHDGSTDGVSR